jgi:hypothetical protein
MNKLLAKHYFTNFLPHQTVRLLAKNRGGHPYIAGFDS